MKNFFIFIAVLFVFACNSGNDKKTGTKVKYSDLANDNLKGDIQTIEETPFKVDSEGKIGDIDSCCIDVTYFDKNGNAVKFTSKDSKGTLKNESVFTRHENGLWMGSKDTKDGGKPVGSMKVEIDDKGQYTLAEAFDSTGKLDVYYTNITQNEYGQVLSWKQYDKDSVFRMEGESKFDKSLQTGFIMKDSVGKVKSSNSFKYNDKGEQAENLSTTVTKDSTKTTVTKYTYDTHDDMGNWTQRTNWDEKGKAVRIIRRVYTFRKKEEMK